MTKNISNNNFWKIWKFSLFDFSAPYPTSASNFWFLKMTFFDLSGSNSGLKFENFELRISSKNALSRYLLWNHDHGIVTSSDLGCDLTHAHTILLLQLTWHYISMRPITTSMQYKTGHFHRPIRNDLRWPHVTWNDLDSHWSIGFGRIPNGVIFIYTAYIFITYISNNLIIT